MRGGAVGIAKLTARFACEVAALAALVDGGVELVGGLAGIAVGVLAALLTAALVRVWPEPVAQG